MNGQEKVYRIMDANLNRASEGLRVIEDGIRFILGDRQLTQKVKELRHSLVRIIKEAPGLNREKLLFQRDSRKDVGIGLKEEKREGFRDLIRANFKRVEEAERSLEEFGKLLIPSLGQRFEEIRFQTYSLEKEIGLRLKGRHDFSLYVITDSHLIKEEEFEQKIKEVVSNGARVVQLREKSLPLRPFLERALKVRKITHNKALFIVNDRVDIAIASRADGVHLGQKDLPVPAARKILGEDKIIGVSTHSIEQARQAEREGADYVAIGPIFPTSSKPDSGPPKGIEIISPLKKAVAIPVIAIGGINEENLTEVLKAGADGIAAIRAVFKDKDVGLATRRLSQRIQNVIYSDQERR